MSLDAPALPPASERPEIAAFAARAEERGWARESELEALATRCELDESAVGELRDALEAAGVDIADDCGKDAPATTYANGDLVHFTVDTMAQFLSEAARFPLLTAAEELDLAKRIERGDLDAKEKLISHNLRLVVSIAKRYPATEDMPLLDLVQEGTLGLIRAAEKFDWRKGFRFSTYATLWIRQAIGRGLATKPRAIRLPNNVERRERAMAAAFHRLAAELGREPTPQELAEQTQLPIEQVLELTTTPRVVTSLDRPVGDEETSFGALLPADIPDVGEEVHIALGRAAVRRAVADMSEPMRSVLKMRYGLNGDPEPQTYAAIGRRLHLDPTGVRQIEERGLRELALRRELEAFVEAA